MIRGAASRVADGEDEAITRCPRAISTHSAPDRVRLARPMGAGMHLSALRGDGSEFSAEISVSPIETADGTLVAATVRDVSERKTAEQKFKGLLESAHDAMVIADRDGVTDVLVAHADLPLASALAGVIRPGLITLVPDRHGDGTNVIALPSRLGFRFAYGAGSFRQHLAEARRHRLGVRVWRDRRLGLDVDVPADLDLPEVREVLGWAPTSEGNPA